MDIEKENKQDYIIYKLERIEKLLVKLTNILDKIEKYIT